MSLFRRLVGVMAALLVLFSVSLFIIEARQMRASLSEQQRTDMIHFAHSLSLSLTPFVQREDWTGASALMQAAFDNGMIQHMVLEVPGTESMTLTNEYRSAAPEWFQSLISLPSVSATRELSSGWVSLGTITLEADDEGGYDQLWLMAWQLIVWLLLGLFIVTALLYFLLHRMLKPLHRLNQQLIDLRIQGYEGPLPQTSFAELQPLIESVNWLGERLREQFEAQAEQVLRLQQVSERDAISGLGNRTYLVRALEEWLTSSEGGALVILRISYLTEIYRREGGDVRDATIKAIGDFLAGLHINEKSILATHPNIEEFVLFLPEVDEKERESFIRFVVETVDEIVDTNPLAIERHRHCLGGVVLHEPEMEAAVALSAANGALRAAEKKGLQWGYAAYRSALAERSRFEWRMLIERALEEGAFSFVAQPVVLDLKEEHELHREVFLRLHEGENQHTAAAFLPLINHYQLGSQIDQFVFSTLAMHPTLFNTRLAVNLSLDTLATEEGVQYVLNWVEAHPVLAAKLDIEVDEEIALMHLERVQALSRVIHRYGSRFGIDHFGQNIEALAYLATLSPDYVKIDQAFFLRDEIDTEFLRSLCMAAHQVEAQVIVTRVETEEQVMRVEYLGADGYQGFILPSLPLMEKPAGTSSAIS